MEEIKNISQRYEDGMITKGEAVGLILDAILAVAAEDEN